MDKRKKRPGGAEKLRLKKLKSLEVEATKYSKLTDLFGAGVTTPAGAAAQGDERVEAYMPRQVQGKSSWSVQGESQTNSGSPKTAPPEREKAGESEECVSPKTGSPEREKVVESEEGYAESLLKYETILTAQIFLRIFEHTSPLSKYLQTAGLDILSAHRMVASTQDTLKSLGRDFDSVKKAADTFVNWTNTEIQERDDTDIEVEATLPQKRRRMKKVLPGEMAQDETLDDADKSYEVNVHNRIMDTAIEAIHRRFLTHGNLYADLACLDPRNFPQLCTSALPQSALQDLSKCLQGFDSRATKENMQAELKSFALQWNRLKESPLAEYKARTVEDGSGGEEDNTEEVEITPISCCSCKECPLCCYQILRRFNMLTDAYPVLGLAYKYLLTLSLTQVACERTFSILKFIKNRLRSTLSSDKLEAFMLMATEKDILMALDSDSEIDRLAEKSELLKKLLH
ncbi:hypothetical protein KUCAC02_011459 [Chaenocephalus aceratus]|uniref:Uncharacterized protein n=1 Tax=Chaenocephalus aceratus TaxID=36190 RepID=A0ACB9WWU0_CHAAC|nr:hypothetical protein KUCAC02_011459 [Chaenocephalus aceratus]